MQNTEALLQNVEQMINKAQLQTLYPRSLRHTSFPEFPTQYANAEPIANNLTCNSALILILVEGMKDKYNLVHSTEAQRNFYRDPGMLKCVAAHSGYEHHRCDVSVNLLV
ncbi:hypothetical protein Pelo_12987 [Pelomyxa schiedti]|nr:hypothetical protein Pelo_12987 [Pelomyxa schiedti]